MKAIIKKSALGCLYRPPSCLRILYGKGMLWRFDTSEKKVWLTFDDGPIPIVTPAVLSILQTFHVKASFFMVGHNIQKHPDIYQRIISERHSVGNHTFSHLDGWKTKIEDYIADIEKAEAYLPDVRLFRPPHGKISRWQKQFLLQKHYTICMWDVLTHDYDPNYGCEDIIKIVKKYVRNGSIINFHDSEKAKHATLQALPYCIDFLLNEGYALQTF